MVPHFPDVSGPAFTSPCGAHAPGNALPAENPKPPLPMNIAGTGTEGGRVGDESSSRKGSGTSTRTASCEDGELHASTSTDALAMSQGPRG